MASERLWFSATQTFTANGGLDGKITVGDVAGFYVKSKVRLISGTQSPILLEVKRIEGTNVIYVGDADKDINHRTNVSAFLVADSASITLFEQLIPKIKPDDIWQAVYAREPIVALRNLLVDKYGKPYDSTNPLPTSAVLNGDVLVNLDALTPATRPDPDNALIAGSADGLKTGVKYAFVNNQRQQVLASHDRLETYTYADFGTKNERITRIDYTSATFPGITVRRDFNYVLDSGSYRPTTSPWSIV